MVTGRYAKARRALGYRCQARAFPDEAPLAPRWEPNDREFPEGCLRGKCGARRELGKATACRCVTEALALWGMFLPSGRGMPLAPCLWERPPRGPDPGRCPRRAGESAARLETRTQEFTSHASVSPFGNVWVAEKLLNPGCMVGAPLCSWGRGCVLSHAKRKQIPALRRCEWGVSCPLLSGRGVRLERPCNSHRSFLSIVGQGSECEHVKWNPKGDELRQITAKPWETAVEAGLYTDVQFVCRSLA